MLKIIWSSRAQKELNSTILYWNEHNKSNTYSKKILKEIGKKEEFLLKNPNSGTPLNYRSLFKVQLLKYFSLVFQLKNEEIQIISFWDNRRNPENLEIEN